MLVDVYCQKENESQRERRRMVATVDGHKKWHVSQDLNRVRAELCRSWGGAGPTEEAKPKAGAGHWCLEVAQQEQGRRTCSQIRGGR